MLECNFSFSTENPAEILMYVNQMSKVTATLAGSGPYTLSVMVYPPFDETRFDNVENVIMSFASNVERLTTASS